MKIDFFPIIKELVSDKEKLAMFKKIVTELKEVVNGIKAVIQMIKG